VGAALNGNLRDFGIAEVFQLIGQQRKTGVLEIAHDEGRFRLAIDAGSVVTASFGGAPEHAALAETLVRCGLLTRERAADLGRASAESARPFDKVAVERGDISRSDMEQIVGMLTHDVVFRVLRFKTGSFHFSARAIEHDRPPEALLAAEQILMDGLRMVDEWSTFAALVPSGDTVFRRVGSFELYRQKTRDSREASERAERVFQMIDGRIPARRIIDLSRLGTFEGTRTLAALHECRAIEVVADAPAAKAAPIGSRFGPAVGSALRSASLGAAALAVLAACAFASGRSFIAPPAPHGAAIESHVIGRAAADFEARRLRHAIEAHRYRHGSWPDSLDAVAKLGRHGTSSMAAPEPAAYSYVARGRDVELVAPAHGSDRSPEQRSAQHPLGSLLR